MFPKQADTCYMRLLDSALVLVSIGKTILRKALNFFQLINPWNFHMLFLQYPWKFPCPFLNPLWFQLGGVGGGGVRIYFSETSPGICRFGTLPLEILKKTSFHLWKFCKIVKLEIPKSKTKIHGSSTWVFLNAPRKFDFFLIPGTFLCFSSTTRISMSSTTHVWIFSGITPSIGSKCIN